MATDGVVANESQKVTTRDACWRAPSDAWLLRDSYCCCCCCCWRWCWCSRRTRTNSRSDSWWSWRCWMEPTAVSMATATTSTQQPQLDSTTTTAWSPSTTTTTTTTTSDCSWWPPVHRSVSRRRWVRELTEQLRRLCAEDSLRESERSCVNVLHTGSQNDNKS